MTRFLASPTTLAVLVCVLAVTLTLGVGAGVILGLIAAFAAFFKDLTS